MSSINLTDVTSGYNLAKVNENFQEVERVINEELLHRENSDGSPNALQTDIDANSRRIYNLPKAVTGGEPLRLKDLFGDTEELLKGPDIEHITASEGQTVFTLTSSYVPNSDSMYVFRNGVLLRKTVDYLETGAQQVIITEAANLDDVFSFVPVAVGGVGDLTSDAATGANVGGGIGIYKNANASQLNFKTLEAGSNITISGNADTVRIDGVVSNISASNVGTGSGVYKQKTGDNLEFKTIVAGSNVTVTPGTNTLTIAASLPAGSGEANTASNVGTGYGVFKDKTGVDLRFKTIKAGSNVTIVAGADDLTFNAVGGSGSGWPIINVMDYGADPSGLTSSLVSFNNAAAAANGSIVYVPRGTYAIGSATTGSVTWWIAPGATITGVSSSTYGLQDFSRLTGKIIHMDEGQYRTMRVGSNAAWLEKTRWNYSQAIAEFSSVSRYSEIGVLGASRTSDNPAQTLGSIGVAAYSVNDSTSPKEPAWGMYVNHQKVNGSGPSYGIEIDNVNQSSTFNATPYNMGDGMTSDRSFNLWLSCGAGDNILPTGNAVSAAIGISANPTPFNRGIIFPSGSVNPSYNEIITSFNGGRLAWYDYQGSVEQLSAWISSAGPVSGLDFTIRNQNNGLVNEGLRLDGSLLCLRPFNSGTLDLGASSQKWKNVWFTALKGVTQGGVDYSFEESYSGTFGYYYAFRKDANNTWFNMYPDGTVAISGNSTTGNKLIVWPDGSIFAGHATPTSAGFCVPDGGKFWLNGTKTSYITQSGGNIVLVKNGSVVATW
jgi:hypothetical protein